MTHAPLQLLKKNTELHSNVLESVAEKFLAGCTRKTPDTELFKLTLLSKMCSQAFGHSFRSNLKVVVHETEGILYFKDGAPLGTSEELYTVIKDKWTVFWMIAGGLFKWISIYLQHIPNVQPEVNANESALESLARLIFKDEGDIERLDIEKLSQRAKLPPVDKCIFSSSLETGTIVSWSTMNRLFNVNPEILKFRPESNEVGSTGSALHAGILADALKGVRYFMGNNYTEDLAFFDYIDSWKQLLIHTCRVAPNLEQLVFMLPSAPIHHGIKDHLNTLKECLNTLKEFLEKLKMLAKGIDDENSDDEAEGSDDGDKKDSDDEAEDDRFNEYLKHLEPLAKWVAKKLLPELPTKCQRFMLCLHFRVCQNMKDQFVTRIKDFARQKNFGIVKDGEDEDGDHELQMRFKKDERFEIDCWVG